MKKTNIFLVHTQYHIILTINIIFNKYKDYNNIVFYTRKRIDKTLSSNCNFISFYGIDNGSFGTKVFLKKLLDLNPERFFFFQENCSETIYLTHFLSKKNITISLVQDGSKPYHTFKKKRLLYCIIRDTLIDYKQMMKRKALVPAIFFHNNYKYAFLKQVKEVWLTFPEKYKNRTNKTILQIPDYSDESIDFAKKIFDFNFVFDECVLYLGQPLKPEYWEYELSIVKSIFGLFPGKRIMYKAHPLQTENMLSDYENMTNISIIRDKAPAELYILSLNNSLVISIGSTSMLTNNTKCKFYYTNKLYKGGRMFSQVEVANPTSHIKVIKSIQEISF